MKKKSLWVGKSSNDRTVKMEASGWEDLVDFPALTPGPAGTLVQGTPHLEQPPWDDLSPSSIPDPDADIHLLSILSNSIFPPVSSTEPSSPFFFFNSLL